MTGAIFFFWGGGIIEYKMYVLIFSTKFVSNISIPRRILQGIFINVHTIALQVKYPLFWSDLNET
jgi:hypothetical protein